MAFEDFPFERIAVPALVISAVDDTLAKAKVDKGAKGVQELVATRTKLEDERKALSDAIQGAFKELVDAGAAPKDADPTKQLAAATKAVRQRAESPLVIPLGRVTSTMSNLGAGAVQLLQRGFDTTALSAELAFYRAILKGSPLPKFTWKMERDGSIRVQTEDTPLEVNLWQATNPKARDIRLATLGPAYRKSKLEAEDKGIYLGRVTKPATGSTAFFVELVFPSGEKAPFKFTTQVSIVPDVLPHRIEEFKKDGK